MKILNFNEGWKNSFMNPMYTLPNVISYKPYGQYFIFTVTCSLAHTHEYWIVLCKSSNIKNDFFSKI